MVLSLHKLKKMKFWLGDRVAGILWVFLNLYQKFLIVSLPEDADLTF